VTCPVKCGQQPEARILSIFVIIGPLLGTFVYQRFGIYLSISIMGLAFLMSAGVLTFLPSQSGEMQGKLNSKFWNDLTEGFLIKPCK